MRAERITGSPGDDPEPLGAANPVLPGMPSIRANVSQEKWSSGLS